MADEGLTGPGASAGAGDSALVGTILAGRYRILQLLGEGAMGAVYLGEHVKIGRRDAIKVLRDALSTDTEAIARFTRGARNVSAIHHPNVCMIYDFSDTADGQQFMAMEFIAGETLKDVLVRDGALEITRAVRIARQVADALQAAHDAGIVHRDLKPANIMVTRTKAGAEQIKVVDFDIAKGPRDGGGDEVTRLGFVVGTPEYMSPEQLMGDALDGRSDIYSLGLVLFRMLTGGLPFQGASTQEMMVQRLTREPLRLSDVMPQLAFPDGLERVIRWALARDVASRPPNAAAFGQALIEATQDIQPGTMAVPVAPIQVPVIDDLPETRIAEPQTRRAAPAPARKAASKTSPIALWGGVAGVVVIGVAAGWFVLSGRGDEGPVTTDPPTMTSSDPVTANPDVTPANTNGGSANPVSTDPASGRGRATDASGNAGSTPPPPPPPAPPSSPVTMMPTAAQDSASVWNLLFALDEEPTQQRLMSVRDSAEAIYARTVGDTQARAAYVAGSARFYLKDRPGCVTWIQKAIAVRSEDSYVLQLNTCRSGS